MKDPRTAADAWTSATHPRRQQVTSAARRVYGPRVDVAPIPGDESEVYLLDLPDGSRKVLKLERPGCTCVLREQKILPALRGLGIPEVAEVLCTEADIPGLDVPAILMPCYEGCGLRAAARSDPGIGEQAAAAMGDLLRRLCRIDRRAVPGALAPDERRTGLAGMFLSAYESEGARARLPADLAVEAARCRALLESPVSAFGGCSDCDVVVRPGGGVLLLDLSHVGACWPLHDLGVSMTWLAVGGGRASPAWANRLLAAFQLDPAQRPLLHQWAVHQVLGHLCLMLRLQRDGPTAERARAIDMAYDAAVRIAGNPDAILPWIGQE
jgi:hypothetical protein